MRLHYFNGWWKVIQLTRLSKIKVSRGLVLLLLVLAGGGCGGWWSSAPRPAAVTRPATSFDDNSENVIRELEVRVKRDPEDFIAYNKLCGYYLQRLRETGDISYLELATRAARASLDILPVEMNKGALAALAQAEYAAHDFNKAREHALLLTQYEPNKSSSHQILGDALLELGDYEGAAEAYRRMEQLGAGGVGAETRLARLALLRGQTDVARKRFSTALNGALNQTPAVRETIAWCWWQRGEVEFATGDYEKAEQYYGEALSVFPGYFQALAATGRIRAARGDMAGALEHYERTVRARPDPAFVAALGDLYKLAGREADAAAQYTLVEQIARLSALNGALYNRQLALFYADHDMKAEEGYALAVEEYKVRRDIYGADAVAWTALKAGKLGEAQAAIKDALRLGTKDARLLYHAGMIAHASGDRNAARDYLTRALALNPQFDPLQSTVARKHLEN